MDDEREQPRDDHAKGEGYEPARTPDGAPAEQDERAAEVIQAERAAAEPTDGGPDEPARMRRNAAIGDRDMTEPGSGDRPARDDASGIELTED